MTTPKNSSNKKSLPNKSEREFWYDAVAADRAVEFFEKCLTHTKGEWAGQPLVLSEWQSEKIIKPLFGWKRADGTRRYRTAYIQIPRKAGKSTLSAGIALYCLLADGEAGAEVYSAAADREQAAIVFEMAQQMADASPPLRSRVRSYKRSIVVQSTASSYKVLSADAYTKHGLNASCIIFDELHAQPNRELWDVLTTSTGARRQPLTVAITTAGYDRHSICYELYSHACKVRDGILIDDSFLPVVYEAEKDDDWQKPETWYKAHPGLGTSVREEYLAAECLKAKQMPAYENTFRRLMLNQWTEQATRWLAMDAWDKCAGDLPDLTGMSCYAGLDLSTTTDISALVLAFGIGAKVHLLPFFFVPEDGVKKRSERDRVPYDLWIKQGHIIATPGAVIDYDYIRAKLNELAEQYQIKEVAIDRWNAAQLSTQLTGDGFEMIGFGQGFASMSSPTKELEKRVLAAEVNHGGNPVLRWMASNVAVEMDAAGNTKPSKAKSTERIDGIVAAIMALGRLGVDAGETVFTDYEFTFV
ncbi:terminase large subunit [Herbaspirillum autotrophicum]|uniref:terminase large subunit n=1 Tax=Herbaspirillum autotrophicum TaxID=180195 RepID=UPI00067D016D|nr:terminase TerL endonuclease subunit [Herbaspirillum autotrophicum]